MPFTDTTKNAMLDGNEPSHMSLHSAFPGGTGANEIAGGSYARQAIAWGAAAAGVKSASNQPAATVPAAATVAWIGYFSALSAGNFLGYAPAGGSPFKYRVDTIGNAIDAPGHGLADDEQVVFYGGTPPAPLVEGAAYFVVGSAADTFQVAATQGGAVIDLTSGGDAKMRCSKIVPETFGAEGTFTATSLTLDLNE